MILAPLLLALLGYVMRVGLQRGDSRTKGLEMDIFTTLLPASWISTRLSVDSRELESARERGELFAVQGSREWFYPAWQFGPGGTIPEGIREAVSTARAAGLTEAGLVALLRRRTGLVNSGRFLDLLFEGRSDYVRGAIRKAATA
ncbi:MAG: hypothetical protein ACTHNB_08265 [Gaiellaceae bacterium]